MKKILYKLVPAAVLVLCLGLMQITLPAAAEDEKVRTTENATVYAGPATGSGAILVLQPNVQVTIIPPKSVIIGKGVTIGEGVFIEGKPWINVRLPDGRIGYVQGSAVCTLTENASVRVGLCSP